MSELITFLIKNFLLSFFTVIFTAFLTKHFERKKEIPRILLTHGEHGMSLNDNISDKHDIVLMGYYKKQRQLDIELKKFLVYNGYTDTIVTTKLLENIVKNYRNIKDDRILHNLREDELSKIVSEFGVNREFLRKLKIYEAYMDNSRWEIKLTNVGKSMAYDLKIEQFPESYFPFISFNTNLSLNDSVSINLIYFDETLRINEYSDDLTKRFECGFTNNKIVKFYLVNKILYNGKDERIFRITYKDCYTKEHEFFCCAKIINSNDFVQNLRIKLNIK